MHQRIRSFANWTAVVALSALPALAHPSHAAESRVPVIDPQLLERMGFAPDATDVYATPRALEQLLMGPAARSTAREETEEAPAESVFGVDDAGETAATGSAFVPLESDTGYETFQGSNRYCTIGSPFFEADLQSIPHGARLLRIRAWYADDSAEEDLEIFLFRTCVLEEAPTPDITNLGSTSSAGSGGWDTSVFNVGEDIDLEHCTYTVRVRLDDGVISCSEGNDLRILKARAQWRRQVSPAPATATFDDVPTTHGFFRHIEALADSGVTTGCDADSFCPNAPLTRGQMAVFLARALGLHWNFPESLP